VAYDNDSAGLLGAKKVAKELGEYKVRIVDWESSRHFLEDELNVELFKGFDVINFFTAKNRQDIPVELTGSDFTSILLDNSKRSFEL